MNILPKYRYSFVVAMVVDFVLLWISAALFLDNLGSASNKLLQFVTFAVIVAGWVRIQGARSMIRFPARYGNLWITLHVFRMRCIYLATIWCGLRIVMTVILVMVDTFTNDNLLARLDSMISPFAVVHLDLLVIIVFCVINFLVHSQIDWDKFSD